MPPKGKPKTTGTKKAVALPKTPQDLEACLAAFLSGEDQKIKASQEVLRVFLNKPQSIPAFFHRLSVATGDPNTRQLACVLVAKKIGRRWAGLHHTKMLGQAPHDAEACRKIILTILHNGDAPRLLIHSLAQLTSTLARLDFRHKRWPELVAWLGGALQSENLNHVDAALRILYRVLESNVAGHLEKYFMSYYQSVCGLISSTTDAVVRHRALLTLHSLLGAIDDDAQQQQCIQSTLPALVPALIGCHKNDETDSVGAIITILVSAMENAHFDAIAPAAMHAIAQIVLDQELDLTVRTQAATFISDYIAVRPIRLTQAAQAPDGTTFRFLDLILHVCFQLILEEDDEPFILNEDNPQKVSLSLFEQLFRFISRDELFPECIKRFNEYISHANPHYRKAAYVIVMVCAEHVPMLTYDGQHATYNGISQPLLNTALRAAVDQLPRDPTFLVQDTICVALSWVCEEFGALIEHRNLWLEPVNVILQTLQMVPAGGELRLRLFVALDAFIEAIGVRVVEVLQPIMDQLSVQLQQPNIEQQEAAIETISSVALSSGTAFQPYVAGVVPCMAQILSAPDADEYEAIKSKALRSLSACARAVGANAWTPELKTFLFDVTQTCFKIAIDDREESSHAAITSALAYLGNVMTTLVETLQEDEQPPQDMVELLSKTYDAAIYALSTYEGFDVKTKDEDGPGGADLGEAEAGSDGEDDEDEKIIPEAARKQGEDENEELFHEDAGYLFTQDALEMKSSAMSTLVMLLSSLGKRCMFLQPCEMTDYHYPMDEEGKPMPMSPGMFYLQENPELGEEPIVVGVTKNPLLRLQHFALDSTGYLTDQYLSQCLTLLTTSLEVVSAIINFKRDVGIRHPIPAEYQSVVIEPVQRYIDLVLVNEDISVVSTALGQLGHLLDYFGPSLIHDGIATDLFDTLDDVLSKKVMCFSASDFDDVRSGNGEDLLESAFDLVNALARWLGPLFLQEFFRAPEKGHRLQLFIDFCAPERAESFRANAVACLADIIHSTGVSALDMAPIVFPLAGRLVQDPSPAVRHNATFLAGELSNIVPEAALAQLPPGLTQTLFQYFLHTLVAPQDYHNPNTSTQDQAIHDNAASAAIRFMLNFPQTFGYDHVTKVLECLPFSGDDVETVKTMTCMPRLLQNAFESVKPSIPKIIVQLALIMSRDLCELYDGSQSILVPLVKSLFQQCPAEAQQAIALLGDNDEAKQALQATLQMP